MYRKIESQFWIDPEVRSLDPLERYLFLYLITNMHTHVSGLYYLPLSTMAYESALDPHQVSRCLKTLVGRHKVFYDDLTEIVWIKKMLFYQGNSPKIVKSVSNHLSTLHHCSLINSFLKQYQYLNIPYRYSTDTVSDTVCDTDPCSSSISKQAGNKQLQEKEKECEEREKPKARPFLSMPDFEAEDRKKQQDQKALLMRQAKSLGVA